jgi:photosystem II stability/assembly factor-like uncharacterized protein
MSDYRELLEQERRKHAMRDGSVEGLERRRNRKRRNGQIVAGIVALVIAAAGVGGGLYAFRSSAGPKPAGQTPTPTPSPVPGSEFAAPSRPSGPIQFVDDTHGWAVNKGRIYATSDGGKRWSPQTTGPIEVTGVTFLDANRGWATQVTGMLRTVDGGVRWTPVGEPRAQLTQVQFQDPEVGWGLRLIPEVTSGPTGMVVMTTDGGENWVDQTVQADSVCYATDGETKSVWAAGPGEGGISFLRSTDGGKSWNDQPIRVPDGEPWSASLQCFGTEVWVQLRDGGAAGHNPYGVFQSVDGAPARLVMQEAGTVPFGHQDGVFESDDPYPGPFNVVAPGIAYSMNWCPACSGSLASVSITITSGGDVTDRFPVLTGDKHGEPLGVSFLPPEGGENVRVHGWALLNVNGSNGPESTILETTDGGRTWTVSFGPGS